MAFSNKNSHINIAVSFVHVIVLVSNEYFQVLNYSRFTQCVVVHWSSNGTMAEETKQLVREPEPGTSRGYNSLIETRLTSALLLSVRRDFFSKTARFQRSGTATRHSKIATDRSPIDARAPNEHVSTGPGWGQIWVLGVGLELEGGEKAFPSEQVLTGMQWSNGDSPVDRQTDRQTDKQMDRTESITFPHTAGGN